MKHLIFSLLLLSPTLALADIAPGPSCGCTTSSGSVFAFSLVFASLGLVLFRKR